MYKKPISVTFYQRKPRAQGNYSIEIYFDAVRSALPENIIIKVAISKYESSGFFKRLYNALEAIGRQGDVNHVTGDIHYVNYFLSKKKNLLTVHDCGQLKILSGLKRKIFRFFWFTLPALRTRYITTNSAATKDDLLNYIHFDSGKITPIPVCISAAFKRHDKTFNALKPRILQIGTAANKNIERLILALEGISCQLVIVGSLTDAIKQQAREKNIELVLFEKPLSEEAVIEQYKLADIVTLISTLEGFGMPVVEANTVGRVVITGNISSMPEVAHNAAHLTDPFSVEIMRSGFLKIINDDAYRNSLIENGYENCKRFSVERIAAQFTEMYETIAARS